MLERFALRLETYGRRLLRGQLNKRMLHSAFWVHGAGKLDLSSATLFGFGLGSGKGYGTEDYAEGGESQPRDRGVVKDIVRLEFLYPTKTLEFLRYLSVLPRVEDHKSLPLGNVFSHGCKRLYTTARKGSGSEIKFPAAEEEPEPDETFVNLQHIRSLGVVNRFDQVWYHYLQEKGRGDVLSKKERRKWVHTYLVNSQRPLDKQRIVTMLQQIPDTMKRPDDYRNIVHALLDLNMPEAALSVLEDNITTCYSSLLAGFERFIAHCIPSNWDMAVKAWELLEACPPDHPNLLKGDMIAYLVPGFIERYLELAETAKSGTEQRLVHELLRGALQALTRPSIPQKESKDYELFWNAMRSLDMEIKAEDYEVVLFHLYRIHDFTRATELYLVYRKVSGLKPKDTVLNAALRAFREQMDYRGMQMVFDDWFAFGSQPDQQAYYIIMTEMARHGEAAVVKELVDQFFERFRIDNIRPFNHLMHAHTIRGELDEVVKVFNQIKEKGLQIDSVCYNIIINAYAKAYDVDGALERVQEMIGASLKPDIFTWTTLITMASERGDAENTERLFDEAKEAGFEPNNMMYAAVIAAKVAVGDLEGAELVLQAGEDAKAKSRNSQPTTQLWNNLLTAYALRQDSGKLNEAFHRMRNARVPFDEYTYGILMHSLCLIDRVEAAEKILRALKEEGFTPNEIQHAIVMIGYMRRRDLGKVWDTFRDMGIRDISPYSTSLAVLIQASAFTEHAKWRIRGGELLLESAEEILAQVSLKVDVLDLMSMDPVKAATPPWLFTPLISILGKEGFYHRSKDQFQAFLTLADAQRPGGAKPSLKMYSALMNAHLKGKDIDGVRLVWEASKRLAVKLSVPVKNDLLRSTVVWSQRHLLCTQFNIFIEAMGLVKDLQSIDIELEALMRAGFEFDNNNWNSYTQVFTINGDLARSFMVCEAKLMPGWPGRKGYYYTQPSEVKGPRPVLYPFIRTLEALTAELRQVEIRSREGNNVATGVLRMLEESYPMTFDACQNLVDKEARIAKEVGFRVGDSLSRDGRRVPWGLAKSAENKKYQPSEYTQGGVVYRPEE